MHRDARTIAVSAMVALTILLDAGISDAQQSGQGSGNLVLEVGNFAAPRGSERWLEKEIQAFELANPNITIKSSAIGSPQRRNEPIETLTDLAAHVVGLDAEAGYEAQYMAARRKLVPIENFLPDPSFTLDDFPASLLTAVEYRGQHWGVPWFASTELLLCNWPLFEEAGLERPPVTWDEFFEYAEKLTRDVDGDGVVDQFGFKTTGFDNTTAFVTYTMILQQGGEIMKNGRFDPSKPETQKAIAVMRKLIVDPEFGTYDRSSITAALRNKTRKHAMYFISSEDVRSISDNQNLRLVPLPTFSQERAALFGARYFAIRKSDAAHEAAAWEFVKWMTRSDISLPLEWMGYPSRNDFILREDFKTAAKTGIQGLEMLYTEPLKTVEIGNPAFHRFLGVYYLWRGILAAIRSSQSAFDERVPSAAAEANKVISPISTGADSLQRFR